MNVDKIKSVMDKLALVLQAAAGVGIPATSGVGILVELFKAGTELNELLQQIKQETPDTADSVLLAVIQDYTNSSQRWDTLDTKEKKDEG